MVGGPPPSLQTFGILSSYHHDLAFAKGVVGGSEFLGMFLSSCRFLLWWGNERPETKFRDHFGR